MLPVVFAAIVPVIDTPLELLALEFVLPLIVIAPVVLTTELFVEPRLTPSKLKAEPVGTRPPMLIFPAKVITCAVPEIVTPFAEVAAFALVPKRIISPV
jgi:hypothetical protein